MNKAYTFAKSLVEYAEQTEGDAPEFVIPEDLSALSDEDLTALHAEAVGHFDALYGDGSNLSPENLTALQGLTEGIEALATEVSTRESAQAERDATAAELASRIAPEGNVDATEEAAAEPGDEDDAVEDEESASTEDLSADAPAERGAIRVNLSGTQRRSVPSHVEAHAAETMKDLVFSPDGKGMDWADLGKALDRRLAGFNATAYANASAAGRDMREQHSLAVIRKPIPEGMTINSSDPDHVDDVIRRAVDEARLPGGSLVASGGWCAPSETLYDLIELESRDGLISVPEVGIARGGIKWTPGPTFSDIYAKGGFGPYTEVQDQDGKYATGNTVGPKPFIRVDCPSFTEARLDLIGLAITAGLLQQRGYPEVVSRTIRGALVAHDHRVAAEVVSRMVTGSTAVTATPAQVGSAAPLLDAIELQVEHYRYIHRLTRSTTLEAVFPYWVRGAIRSDLARRQGLDLLAVTDAQIDAWFSLRGVAAQYIYNWQDITGAAGSFLAWPATVKFLLYSAGTWIRGTSDVLTLDTIYDSTNLAKNDYTALFTEEGLLVAKRGHDSRCVTVALSPTGMTGGGQKLLAAGTLAP